MKTDFNTNTLVKSDENVVSRRIQEEEVLLQLVTGSYYGLDEIGSRAWELLTVKHLSVANACEEIAAEYDAPVALVETDVVRLVRELESAKLVTLETPA